MEDAALLFDVPSSVAEQALVDLHTVVCGVSVSATPQAVNVAFIGAMFPPVCKVIEACVKHSPGDV
jgi:hypothetical protein